MQPKFSVVMPVYNVEKYLRNSIQSILNQTISTHDWNKKYSQLFPMRIVA